MPTSSEDTSIRLFPTRIVVPIDFSPQSEVAARFGFEFAAKLGRPLTLLHIVEPPYEFPSRRDEILTMEFANAKKELESLKDGFLRTSGLEHVEAAIDIREGTVTSSILDIAENDAHQLLVMGLSCEKRLNKMLYGTVTNRVLLESMAPVMAVSDQMDYRAFDRIVFATDFRERDADLLLRTRALADDLEVDLECIHFITRKEDTDKTYASRTDLEGRLDYRVVVQLYMADDLLEGVSRYLRQGPRSLLVISRYKTKFFSWLLSNATASQIATVGQLPLIMMPGERDSGE